MCRDPEDLRARILRLSAGLFAERGYHATGLTELLDKIGVARGGFYHHFKSKENVLLEIVTNTIERILESSAAIVDQQLDPDITLRLLCDDLSQAIIDNQPGFVVFLREYSALGDDAKERVLALRRRYLDRWETVLEAGTHTGRFVAHAWPCTEGILGMWIYSFAWNLGAVEPATIAAHLGDFVLRGVSADVALPARTGEATGTATRRARAESTTRRPPKRTSGAA